jgi:putative toxin-antitoxin system antitoxin component (TIGR02293 family)
MASGRKAEGPSGKGPRRKLARVARTEAERIFGSAEAAKEWLEGECRALGFVRPIDLLHDDAGAHKVMIVLMRIEHGVFT